MAWDFKRAALAGATGGGSEYFGMAKRTLGGMFGGGGDLYDRNLINQRRGEIDDFARQLATARAKYVTSLGNMYQNSFNRFSQDAEARFANRGLAVNGGAFAAALARETSRYQSELEPLAFNAERDDLTRVESMRDSLFGNLFKADVGERGAKYKANQDMWQGLGNFAGTAALMYAFPPAGAAKMAMDSQGGRGGWGGQNQYASLGNRRYGNRLSLF